MNRSEEVRQRLVDALQLDLVGPWPGHPWENEQLKGQDSPQRWYVTGFLVPTETPDEFRFDPESQDTLDGTTPLDDDGTDDEDLPEPPAARRSFFPSSLGLSVLLPADVQRLTATVTWGDYRLESADDPENPDWNVWQRVPRRSEVEVVLPQHSDAPTHMELPGSSGVTLCVVAKAVPHVQTGDGKRVDSTQSVSVFVVNTRESPEGRYDEQFLFQVQLRLTVENHGDPEPGAFVARSDPRGSGDHDWDERTFDLHYRDVGDYAVGHGVSTHADVDDQGLCRTVMTTWIPQTTVEKVAPAKLSGVVLDMETLAGWRNDAEAMQAALRPLVDGYRDWISDQRSRAPYHGRRGETAAVLLDRCEIALARIERGIAALSEPRVLSAFASANQAMAMAARQRESHNRGCRPTDVPKPAWRPFQLAFVLMNLPGVVSGESEERDAVDLLFFPTGGGKTEAYLGLAAFVLLYRRVCDPSVGSAGVSVIMRYTLRLLTLDQLARASTLICALELLRQEDVETLGKWPFEIGLWVGKKATPNRMGKKGDGQRETARTKTIAYKNDSKGRPSPVPLENCPWCNTKFTKDSFYLVPNPDEPLDLKIVCVNMDCAFIRDQALPILAVDEPIYRRLPCFLIATVDKFATLPWWAAAGKLFGRVDRYDKGGFYGFGEAATQGTKLPGGGMLPPPDLIIQDELHLISGPLGTMVGLYETAVEALCKRESGGRVVLPKIVASTATVRRAREQVSALFARKRVDVFPPPGPDRNTTFFSETVPVEQAPGRVYVGVAAQGRSLKVVLLRTYLCLLSVAKAEYEGHKGALDPDNPADPYMTLLGYFSALRELGGSRRLVEDEVRSRLIGYSLRKRVGEEPGLYANRVIHFEAVELTSREPTHRVAEAKQRLALRFAEDKRVDVALATNMISVGLDIVRLGLMVVLGQPKSSSEYIQATSRVGRDDRRPGLVVTLLNIHRPRDRSHYERFEAYHQSIYRWVESTSVTPFAPQALDRGLAAVVVAMARHGERVLTPPKAAIAISRMSGSLGWVTQGVVERAKAAIGDEEWAQQSRWWEHVGERVEEVVAAWEKIAGERESDVGKLQYNRYEIAGVPALLLDPLDPALEAEAAHSARRKFKAAWSLRDVEPEVPVMIGTLDGGSVEDV